MTRTGIFITVLFVSFSVLLAQALNDHSSRHALTQKQIVSEIGFTGYIQGIPGAAVYSQALDSGMVAVVYHSQPSDGVAIVNPGTGKVISNSEFGVDLQRCAVSGRYLLVTDKGKPGVLGKVWLIDLEDISHPQIIRSWSVSNETAHPFGIVVAQEPSTHVISAVVAFFEDTEELIIPDITQPISWTRNIHFGQAQDYISLGDKYGVVSLANPSYVFVVNNVTNEGDVYRTLAINSIYVPGALASRVSQTDTILCVAFPQDNTLRFYANILDSLEKVKKSNFIAFGGYSPENLRFSPDGRYLFVFHYLDSEKTRPIISIFDMTKISINKTVGEPDSTEIVTPISQMPLRPGAKAQLGVFDNNLLISEGDSLGGAFVFSAEHYLKMLSDRTPGVALDFKDIVSSFESVNLINPSAMVKSPLGDGDPFALADKNSIYLMDNQGLKLPIDIEDVRDLHFSPNGQVLYVVDSGGWLLAIDVNPTTPDFLKVITQTKIIDEEFSQVHIASTSDGKYLFVTFTTDKGAFIEVIYAYSYYPLTTNPVDGEIYDITAIHEKIYLAQDFGMGIYELTPDYRLRRTGQIPGIGQPVRVESIPGSDLILATYFDGGIKLFDTAGNIICARSIKGLIPVGGAVISSDGKQALVCVKEEGRKKLVSVDIQPQDVLQDNWTSQNYPNPFSDQTTIELEIRKYFKQAGLKIYNIRGQLVKKIEVHPGQTKVIWKGDNNQGKQVASGIYFYRLEIDGRNQKHAKRMLLF